MCDQLSFLRRQAYVILSGDPPRCTITGETNIDRLVIDHPYRNGKAERTLQRLTGRKLYRHIIKLGVAARESYRLVSAGVNLEYERRHARGEQVYETRDTSAWERFLPKLMRHMFQNTIFASSVLPVEQLDIFTTAKDDRLVERVFRRESYRHDCKLKQWWLDLSPDERNEIYWDSRARAPRIAQSKRTILGGATVAEAAEAAKAREALAREALRQRRDRAILAKHAKDKDAS